MGEIYTWRDSPTPPPTYEKRCVNCELWHQCPSCEVTGWCDFLREYTGIGEGCEE